MRTVLADRTFRSLLSLDGNLLLALRPLELPSNLFQPWHAEDASGNSLLCCCSVHLLFAQKLADILVAFECGFEVLD